MKPFAPPTAVVTRVLIVICVVVQISATLGGSAFAIWMVDNFGLVPARLTSSFGSGTATILPGILPAPLTLLTSMFVHGGWIHLLVNMVLLSYVGRYAEWVIGRWRYFALYMLGGIAGGLLQVVVDPGSLAPVVGASGAIAAVVGAYAVLFARSRAAARKIFGISISSDALTALWYAAAWIGLQFLTAVAFNTGPLQVAIWTHIGGFVTGLLFAQPFVRGPQIDPRV
jgi:membrane associated rhomboid family serine protease